MGTTKLWSSEPSLEPGILTPAADDNRLGIEPKHPVFFRIQLAERPIPLAAVLAEILPAESLRPFGVEGLQFRESAHPNVAMVAVPRSEVNHGEC